MIVMDYVNKFNHLSQYASIHVDTDEKKKDRFFHGLSYILQEKLYTANYQTFGAMMNAAIAMEGLQQDSQVEWKCKQVATGSSSHPRRRKYRLSGGCPINLPASIRFDSLDRLFRHLPLSIVHLLSKCNISSPRDSRSHLVKDRGTSLVLVLSVARKATMLGSVCRTSLRSLLSPQLTLV